MEHADPTTGSWRVQLKVWAAEGDFPRRSCGCKRDFLPEVPPWLHLFLGRVLDRQGGPQPSDNAVWPQAGSLTSLICVLICTTRSIVPWSVAVRKPYLGRGRSLEWDCRSHSISLLPSSSPNFGGVTVEVLSCVPTIQGFAESEASRDPLGRPTLSERQAPGCTPNPSSKDC